MEHNNDDTINSGNDVSHTFCWATSSPSHISFPSQTPLVHLLQEIKENMSEYAASLTPVITSRKRGRPFKPAAPSRTTLKERNGSSKREWSDDEITQLIYLWKQEEALYNCKCDSFSNCDKSTRKSYLESCRRRHRSK